MSKRKSIRQQLLAMYAPEGRERCGFLVGTRLVEVENICPDDDGFEMTGADILRFADKAGASWHTHPGGSANLSVGDYDTFRDWPDMNHFIIGQDGIATYTVEDGEVLRDED